MRIESLANDSRLHLGAMEAYSDNDWKCLLSGAMCYKTADFAHHPCDHERARWMVARAAKARAAQHDIESELADYLARKVGDTAEFVEFKKKQFGYFREFFRDQIRPIKGGWVIYKTDGSDGSASVVHVLRSRLTPDKALEAACLIYEANELGTTAKFICAKSKFPRPYPIWEWRVKGRSRAAKWPGEFRIGENPTYVLRLAQSIKCPKGFIPDGELEWAPAVPPANFADL